VIFVFIVFAFKRAKRAMIFTRLTNVKYVDFLRMPCLILEFLRRTLSVAGVQCHIEAKVIAGAPG